MSQQTKGYWLFDRNDKIIKKGEAIISSRTGNLLPMTFMPTFNFARVAGPWAIYKWIWIKEND